MAAPSAMSQGAMLFAWGPHAGGNAACCKGLVDLTLLSLAASGGSANQVCQSDACGNSTVNESTDAITNPWSPFVHTPTPPPQNYLPNQATFVTASKAVFGNSATCYLNAKAHVATNYFTGGAITAYPAFLAANLAPALIGALEWRLHTDMDPRANIVQITNEENFCFFANNSHDPTCSSAATQKFTAPNCVHVHSVSRNLYFTMGPQAASIKKCCASLRQALFIANKWQYPTWNNTGCDSTYTDLPGCMAAGGSSHFEYWKVPAARSTNKIAYPNPSELIGNFANYNSYDESMKILGANNNECINLAAAYAANNSATGYNSMFNQVAPALIGLVADHANAPPKYEADNTPHPARLSPVIAANQTTRCFKPWGTGFMFTANPAPTCTNLGTSGRGFVLFCRTSTRFVAMFLSTNSSCLLAIPQKHLVLV